MTVELHDAGDAAIGLDDLVAGLHDLRFDPDDEAAFVAAAPLLAALSRDRRFLGDRLIAELKSRARGQERDNGYGAQVVLLHRGAGWFVRANFWPDARDPLLRASGARAFFYGVPHNHNFHFLTIGHAGPGYWSDYYRFVPRQGLVAGDPAGLAFVGRSRLVEGRMLLYRADVDVHAQDLPDATSVSLNIVQGTPGRAFADQYRFDLGTDAIAGQLAHSASEPLLRLLPALGGDDGRDLLGHFARRHPAPRLRRLARELLETA